MMPLFVCVCVCVCVWLFVPRCLKLNELHELNELDERTIARPHIDFASRFRPRQLWASTILAGDQMKYVSRSGGDTTRHRGLEEDCRIGGGLEEDGRRIGGGLEEDWRRIGGRLE